jgi:hypothetical protein
MPRVQKIIYTCGECAAQGVENHAEGFDIVIRNSETGEVVVASTWEGCVAHREPLDAFVESVRAYGTPMRDYNFSFSEKPVVGRDRGYGGPQPSTRGITTNARPAARAIQASNGRTATRPAPKPALAPPPPPAGRKPLEGLSQAELGRKLVTPPAFVAPPSDGEPSPPPASSRVPPAPTPASTGVTSPAEPEGRPATGHKGNRPSHTGTAVVKNGKIVMETVLMSCMNHSTPKPVTWRGRGSHMKDYHDKANYWEVDWRYDNLPEGEDGKPWKMHECGYIIDEAKNEICLLEFPNPQGVEGHRRNVRHHSDD